MLHRMGNKKRLADRIIQHFPKHDIYLEPFFGAGGLFFKKPKANFNFINDNNEDVFNLYQVLRDRPDEFIESFRNMPIDQNLFNYWTSHKETEPIRKALRFILLSNSSHLGSRAIFSLYIRDIKKVAMSQISQINKLLDQVRISNLDFEYFLKKISFRTESMKVKAFIYCDPPYLNRHNNYESEWTKRDTVRLFVTLMKLNIKFAISETDNNLIYYLADYFKLNVIDIGESLRYSKPRKELLITNY